MEMAQATAADNKVVVFQVGPEEYAVDIGAVREVGAWSAPTPIPDAPPLVEGVINLRGEIIPILDLGRLFRTTRTQTGEHSRIMVMDVAGQQAGFVVDGVSEVHTVAPGSLSPPSPVLRSGKGAQRQELVIGIIKLGEGRLVVQLDPARILASVDLAGVVAL